MSAECGGVDRCALHDHIDVESDADAGQGHGRKIADIDIFEVIAPSYSHAWWVTDGKNGTCSSCESKGKPGIHPIAGV